ncbi:MAG: M48 family metallopeptidase [Ruminococcus sp.]|nr:M48 family metallopeptidase [Ruminococcus sp.]
MKRLASVEIDGEHFDYLLDIGKRSKAYLSVKDGVVTVRLPYGCPPAEAQKLILSHKDWIKDKLERCEEKSHLPQSFSNGESFSLLGTKRELKIEKSPQYKEPYLDKASLTVYISESMDEQDAKRLFYRYVVNLCEERVKRAFEKYTEILNLYPRKITFKQMTSRWGSCSSNGSISINIDIICFDQECIDYVVVHELCHLKYMNHGEDFWALVSTCCPNYKQLREKMKH